MGLLSYFITSESDRALVVKTLMEHRYRECDNQRCITLECDAAHCTYCDTAQAPEGTTCKYCK